MARKSLAVVGHITPLALTADPTPVGLAALAALGQATRLEIFRLLIRHEPGGLPAGAIAEIIDCPQNTLSSHLAILARAKLTYGTRAGRSIVYRADMKGMREFMAFLVTDCCEGHPELCSFQFPSPPKKSMRAPAAGGGKRRKRASAVAAGKRR